MVCRHLGSPAVFSSTAAGRYGQATGPIWAQGFYCSAVSGVARRSLADCAVFPWAPSYTGCDHRSDVGITCFTGTSPFTSAEDRRSNLYLLTYSSPAPMVHEAAVNSLNYIVRYSYITLI